MNEDIKKMIFEMFLNDDESENEFDELMEDIYNYALFNEIKKRSLMANASQKPF